MTLSKEFLTSLGVLDWGYTEDPIPSTLAHYQEWTDKKWHGPLEYLNDHRKDLRSDLRRVYPEFQSALVFLFDYRAVKKWMLENNKHQVASYTLGFEGEDYHYELKRRLITIQKELEMESFITLDIQPVLERDLAYKAGLGWFGKNSMMINQKYGSYFMIGSLLLNQKLEIPENKMDMDHCGQCTACAEACPTDAIDLETRTIKASQCISTFTIELFKDAPAPEGFDKSRGEFFGCDICQDVCPWNKKTLSKVEAKFSLKSEFKFLKDWFYQKTINELVEIMNEDSNRGLRKKLAGTPFDRPGKEGWLKNLKARQNASSKKHKGEE